MDTSSSLPSDVDVLIVGGGVAGLTSSLLLSRLGVRSLLVERHPGTSPLPKAHILNQRTMEIFSEVGVADDVYKAGAPLENMSTVAWATSLAGPRPEHGRRIGRVDSWGGGADREAYSQASPCMMTNLPQIRLEPILRARATASAPGRVLFHHELVGMSQDDEGVSASVRSLDDDTLHSVRARYLIGADGGHTVGPAVGIRLSGLKDVLQMVSAHISADLSPYIDDPTVVLQFFLNPDGHGSLGSGVLVKMGPEHWDERSEEWAFHAMVPPGSTRAFDDAFMKQFIHESLGVEDLDFTLHAVSRWQLQSLLADRYRAGRVFLAGDAAHRHFPTTGLGLNTAVQDVHNLAWKLHAVLMGHAGEKLLDTYDDERRAVGRRNVEQATTAAFAHARIDEAIGLTPDLGREEAWSRFTELLSGTAETAELRARVSAAIKHERHEVRAHNIELGYTYTSSAVVHDGTAAHVYADPVLDFRPQTRPGHRIPHAWLERDGRRVSTYGLTGPGRFTLITDPRTDGGSRWAKAAEVVGDRLGVPVDVLRITDDPADGTWTDAGGEWAEQREIQADGAVLVRPDQHVGWRSATACPDAEKVLEEALLSVLARES